MVKVHYPAERAGIMIAGVARVAGLSAPNSVHADRARRSLPGTGRVLVVEDEPLIRDTVRVLIALEGCDARTANDGTAALAILEQWQPDLILLDLTLPDMNGATFIAAYHRTPPPHAPIILLTG